MSQIKPLLQSMKFNENPARPDVYSEKMGLELTESASASQKGGTPGKITVLLTKHPCHANLLAASEIRSLRKHGRDVVLSALETSLNDCGDLSPEIKAEVDSTHYLRARNRLIELSCHGRALATPLSYFRLLRQAILLDGWFSFVRNRHITDVLKLDSWMRQRGIRHLHAHFGTEAARVAVLMKHFRKISVSLTLCNVDDLHHAGITRIRQKVEAADFIICFGISARTALMRLTPHHQWHKYEVCAQGVDTLRFQPKASRIKPEIFTMLCVGQLEPLNGQRTVLETCRLLRQSGREIRLILVGSGSDEHELKKLAEAAGIEDSVMFTGILNQDRLCDWYSRADVFVNCSLSEGMSLPTMEAMASGLACVSARTTGMLELMREGLEGLLVEPDSAHELAGAIMRLMDDEELKTRLAGYGRARILQKYSLSRTTERFGSLFQTRLSSRHGQRRKPAVGSDKPMQCESLSDSVL